MKKGFTMIELIFVIVILGILASVAIPKLAATRDDAEVSRAAANIRTLVTDLGAYYTAQGKFASIANLADTIAYTGVRTAATNAAKFKVGFDTKDLCQKVAKMPGIAKLCNYSGTGNLTECTITVGGSSVTW